MKYEEIKTFLGDRQGENLVEVRKIGGEFVVFAKKGSSPTVVEGTGSRHLAIALGNLDFALGMRRMREAEGIKELELTVEPLEGPVRKRLI